jgi:hypothetical protein
MLDAGPINAGIVMLSDGRFAGERSAGLAAATRAPTIDDMKRFPIPAALILVVSLAGPAVAQQAPPPVPETPPRLVEPPANVPTMRPANPKAELDRLFEALKVAPTPEAAQYVEVRIWSILFQSGSETVDLLMQRARQAVEGQDRPLALGLLDAIVDISPDFAEAWNRRATLRFVGNDHAGALADLAQTLAREPRHFAAWAGLGVILQQIGQEKRALEAFRRALAINPHMKRAEEAIKALTPKVEGQPI